MLHYNKDYFDWQKKIGQIGGVANKFKFAGNIGENDILLDFGSGGGYMLKNFKCKEKLGIEINPTAREEAKINGIKSVESIDEVADEFADMIISHHALEHVPDPLGTLKQLRSKLKNGGWIVVVVPHDCCELKYNPSDINQHLYTWNRQTLGNLFRKAGFTNIQVNNIRSKWPPYYYKIYEIFGLKIFNSVCHLYALIKRNYQIKIVAKK